MRRDLGQPLAYGPKVAAELSALACTPAPAGAKRLDDQIAPGASPAAGSPQRDQPRNHPAYSKKNLLQPWRKVMWCVARITVDIGNGCMPCLDLYAQSYNAEEPVICLDEKSKQLLADKRPDLWRAWKTEGHEIFLSARPGDTNFPTSAFGSAEVRVPWRS